jgi:hypothetical protein
MHRQQFTRIVAIERDQIRDLLAFGCVSRSRSPAETSKLIPPAGGSVIGTPGVRTCVGPIMRKRLSLRLWKKETAMIPITKTPARTVAADP